MGSSIGVLNGLAQWNSPLLANDVLLLAYSSFERCVLSKFLPLGEWSLQRVPLGDVDYARGCESVTPEFCVRAECSQGSNSIAVITLERHLVHVEPSQEVMESLRGEDHDVRYRLRFVVNAGYGGALTFEGFAPSGKIPVLSYLKGYAHTGHGIHRFADAREAFDSVVPSCSLPLAPLGARKLSKYLSSELSEVLAGRDS